MINQINRISLFTASPKIFFSDTNKMDQSDVDLIEKLTNEKICQAISFIVDVYSKDDPILTQVSKWLSTVTLIIYY